jgi:hypothetical protein
MQSNKLIVRVVKLIAIIAMIMAFIAFAFWIIILIVGGLENRNLCIDVIQCLEQIRVFWADIMYGIGLLGGIQILVLIARNQRKLKKFMKTTM